MSDKEKNWDLYMSFYSPALVGEFAKIQPLLPKPNPNQDPIKSEQKIQEFISNPVQYVVVSRVLPITIDTHLQYELQCYSPVWGLIYITDKYGLFDYQRGDFLKVERKEQITRSGKKSFQYKVLANNTVAAMLLKAELILLSNFNEEEQQLIKEMYKANNKAVKKHNLPYILEKQK